MARQSLERPTINMDTGQAVLTQGTIMLITIYESSLTSPRTVASPIEVTRSGVLGKSSTAISTSAGSPKFSGSTTVRHGDNSLLRS
jgi:hypothetical protein